MSLNPIAPFSVQEFCAKMSSQFFWVKDNVISSEQLKQIYELAKSRLSNNQFRPAAIGKGGNRQFVERIRSDQISWIDDWNEEALLPVKLVLEAINEVARKNLYLPIKRFESHFAFYEVGASYAKHVDRHHSHPSRVLSSVLYLGNWCDESGGELVIYDENARGIKIEPVPGRLVIFDSRLEHEVKPTKAERWSLTSWFRDDLHPLLQL